MYVIIWEWNGSVVGGSDYLPHIRVCSDRVKAAAIAAEVAVELLVDSDYASEAVSELADSLRNPTGSSSQVLKDAQELASLSGFDLQCVYAEAE